MVWKESYRIGIEPVDSQHRELFGTVDKLLKAIEENKDGVCKGECVEAISFLRDYVLRHFRDEEDYQASIGYGGLEAHRKLHREFAATVAAYGDRIKKSNYDMKVVMELSGSLMAWLIYHVTDVDQRITGKAAVQAGKMLKSSADNFAASTLDVIRMMMGLDEAAILKTPHPEPAFEGDLSVEIGLTGDIRGYVAFVYSREFAYSLLGAMTAYKPEDLDEVICSAVAEVSNIISGKAATSMTADGKQCDITTPAISVGAYRVEESEGFHLASAKGDLQVLLSIV